MPRSGSFRLPAGPLRRELAIYAAIYFLAGALLLAAMVSLGTAKGIAALAIAAFAGLVNLMAIPFVRPTRVEVGAAGISIRSDEHEGGRRPLELRWEAVEGVDLVRVGAADRLVAFALRWRGSIWSGKIFGALRGQVVEVKPRRRDAIRIAGDEARAIHAAIETARAAWAEEAQRGPPRHA